MFRVFLVALIDATKLNKIIRQSFERISVCSCFFLMFHYLKMDVKKSLYPDTVSTVDQAIVACFFECLNGSPSNNMYVIIP